jgi:hypothetical protein
MTERLRSRWLAGAGAVLLVLSMSGMVAAASSEDGSTTESTDPVTPAFVDANGNGIDDACETEPVVAAPDAALAAWTFADANADGLISVPEAAHTTWTGGANCNHGGYVSGVANASGDTDETDATETTDETDAPAADCPIVVPETPAEPPVEGAPTLEIAPNAHGVAVSEVAGSPAVGGKNCNHGGAVSEAAHAAKDPHVKATHGSHGKGHGKGHGKP